MTSVHKVTLLVCLALIGFSSWESGILGIEEDETQLAAARVEQVFQEIANNSEVGEVPSRTYHLTEADLNAFLLQRLSEQPQAGVDSVSLRLSQGKLVALVQVDMDKLQVETDLTTKLFLALLNGKQNLELEGQLQVENGRGQYTLQRTELNDTEVPPAVVSAVLSALGRRHNPPFDPTKPFDLPYGIQAVDIQVGLAVIQTGS